MIQQPTTNNQQPITILVTGASGQLGCCIKDIEKQYNKLNVIYTDYPKLDICNKDQVNTFFETHDQIHYCINCAAYTDVDNAEKDINKAFEINAIGPKNLALACQAYNAILIHISTDFVFDGEKSEAYNEADKTNPISVYGNTKLKGEIQIKQALKRYFILRTSWLYSEYGNNFMKTMIRLSQERDALNIVSDQFGTPTYARDLAEVILNIINTRSTSYGMYHYSNLGQTSWFDFAKAIFKAKDIDIHINPIKSKDYFTLAKRPKFSVLDKSKIKETFQIKIPFWRDSLMKAISNYNE